MNCCCFKNQLLNMFKENGRSWRRRGKSRESVLIGMVQSYLNRVMGKPAFCRCKNKDADQLHNNCARDQCLCFRYTDRSIPLHPKNLKFQASSHLMSLYSLVCVGPGRKTQRQALS